MKAQSDLTGEKIMSEAFFNEVEAEFSAGNLQAVVKLLQSRLEREPGCSRSWGMLSETQEALGEYDQALKSANQACHADPQDAAHRARLSAALFNAGFQDQAVEQVKIAVQLAPQDPMILHAAAQIAPPADGLELLKHALTIEKRNFPCWVLRVDLLVKLGRLEEARQGAEYLVQAGSQAADSWVSLAKVQWAEKDAMGALKSLEQALKIEAAHPVAQALLEQIHAESAPPSQRKAFRVQVSLKSNNGQPVFLRSGLESGTFTLFAPDESTAERMAYQSYLQALQQAGHEVKGDRVDGEFQIVMENRGEVSIPAPL